jgi:DNA-binding transcriptional LysR family regulator
MEVGPENALHAAIRDGLGFALLSRSSVRSILDAGQIREVPMSGGALKIGLDLVFRNDLNFSLTRRAFIEAARQRLGPGA